MKNLSHIIDYTVVHAQCKYRNGRISSDDLVNLEIIVFQLHMRILSAIGGFQCQK